MKPSLLLVPLAVVAPVLIAGTPAHAQRRESADVEELRREVKQLRAEVQALRAALAEAAEFDRLRANALVRAMKGEGAVAAPTPAPAKEEPAERPAPSHAAPAPAARKAAAETAPTPMGAVRGRVDVPGGEPVAYVYVENVRGSSARGEKVKIEQVNKTFVPSWAVVQRGTQVEFPNLDNIYHNVFSLSSGNTFDLGLYNSGGEAKSHVFDEPGAVDVYCNIHPQMAASILVVPNRLYAKVKADGSFEIAGVPSGRRKVVAWSPGSRLAADWVQVAPGGAADISLKLERKAAGHRNKAGRPYGSYE